MILTNYDGLESGYNLQQYKEPPISNLTEGVKHAKIIKKVKIITNVEEATNI